MEFTIAAMGFATGRPHTCRVPLEASSVVNIAEAMKREADTLAIQQVAMPARYIWEVLRDQLYGSGDANVVRGLAEQQVLRRVYRTRNQHFSGDVHGTVEIPPLSLALNETVPFFSFTTLLSLATI